MKKKKAVIKLCLKNFFNYRLFEVDLFYREASPYRGFNEIFLYAKKLFKNFQKHHFYRSVIAGNIFKNDIFSPLYF